MKKISIISIIILIVDQLFKLLVEINLNLNESIIIIKDFFMIHYTNNTGAAWSMFSNQVNYLVIFSLIALVIIFRYMNTFDKNLRNTIAFGLLYGGIAGNLIDRLFLGYVRDFISFRIFNYDFPVFNISDIAIFFGVVLLIYAIIKGEDNEDKSRGNKRKNR